MDDILNSNKTPNRKVSDHRPADEDLKTLLEQVQGHNPLSKEFLIVSVDANEETVMMDLQMGSDTLMGALKNILKDTPVELRAVLTDWLTKDEEVASLIMATMLSNLSSLDEGSRD